MEIDTFQEALNTFLKRVPYRPFTVSLINGDRYEVDHPGAVVTRDGVAVYVAPGGVPVIFDHEGVAQITGDLMGQSGSQGASSS
jgi:hypothetical protein